VSTRADSEASPLWSEPALFRTTYEAEVEDTYLLLQQPDVSFFRLFLGLDTDFVFLLVSQKHVPSDGVSGWGDFFYINILILHLY
jgi:hypothetical protein